MPVTNFRREAMTALEAAAAAGDIQIFDEVHNARADTTAWKCKNPYDSTPSEPSVSYLSVSSPLHRAVEANSLPMINHLLALNFSPNIFPLASITCSFSPAMTAIASLNDTAYGLLAPQSDLSLTTPIYKVHILHLAAATLSLGLLLRVAENIPLDTAPPKALLHTLLQIVCLPLNDSLHQSSLSKMSRLHPRTPLPRPYHPEPNPPFSPVSQPTSTSRFQGLTLGSIAFITIIRSSCANSSSSPSPPAYLHPSQRTGYTWQHSPTLSSQSPRSQFTTFAIAM